MSYSKTLAKGMIIVMISLVLTKVLGYGYKIIISRWLGANDFGLFALALAIISLIASIMISGIQLALSRYIAYHREKKDPEKIKRIIGATLQTILITNIIAGIGFWIFATEIAVFFHHPEIASLLKIFAFLLPFYSTLLTLQKIFEGFQRIELSTAADIVLNGLRILLVGALVLTGMTIEGVSTTYLIATICTTVVFWIICEKVLTAFTRNIFTNNVKEMQNIVSFSWPLMISIIVHIIMTWSDTLLLGFYRTASEVGIYNIATPTANLLTVPAVALTTVFMPLMSNLFAKKETEQMMKLYSTVTKWTFLIALPVILAIILFPQRIINSTAGMGYVEGASVLLLLGIGVFINAIAAPANMILLAMDKTKFMMKNSIIACIISLGLNFYLIPKFGVLGAGIAFLASSLIIALLRMIEIKTLLQIIPLDKKIGKLMIMSIVTAIVAIGVDMWLGTWIMMDIWRLGANILSIGSVYVGLLYFTKCFDEEDKEIINAIKAKMSKKI
ncbi:flippase [Candidatus Woesearchaeota archaeon]|nr:flippase [Candidatus Woesearchaeota archaeon]